MSTMIVTITRRWVIREGEVPCPLYGRYVCNFKLIMQIFFHKFLLETKRRSFEVDFDVVWSTVQLGKGTHYFMDKPKDEKSNKTLSFFRSYRASFCSFKQHRMTHHCQGDYPECLPKPSKLARKSAD